MDAAVICVTVALRFAAGLEEAARVAETLTSPSGPPSMLPTNEMLGQALLEAGARDAYRELQPNWGGADPDLEELTEVRSGAGETCGDGTC